jgi:phage repressor protein C with HTH and peptisase S24 domain
VVELVDGQGFVKQFIKQDDETLVLHQFNPAQNLIFRKSDVKNPFRIVGTAEGI